MASAGRSVGSAAAAGAGKSSAGKRCPSSGTRVRVPPPGPLAAGWLRTLSSSASRLARSASSNFLQALVAQEHPHNTNCGRGCALEGELALCACAARSLASALVLLLQLLQAIVRRSGSAPRHRCCRSHPCAAAAFAAHNRISCCRPRCSWPACESTQRLLAALALPFSAAHEAGGGSRQWKWVLLPLLCLRGYVRVAGGVVRVLALLACPVANPEPVNMTAHQHRKVESGKQP